MHQAYVKTICKEKLTYTATLPKIAASTTVDCQDRIQPLLAGGVRMSQRGGALGQGSLCTLAAGGGGGGLWAAINVAFFVVYICTTI